MDGPDIPVSEFIERIPSPEEIRHRLSRNLRENRLLRQILRMAEQRNKVKAASDPNPGEAAP